MQGVLLVPMHLDALCLKNDLSVVDAKVDFSRIPYWDGEREVNHNVANLSEELLARPFEDRGLQLKSGIHLHWALPDGLTRGQIGKFKGQMGNDGTNFPAVPNRWLVTRSRIEAGTEVIEQQWIVESDYLHPHEKGPLSGSVTIPYPAPQNAPPFRYLGRKVCFENWKEDAAGEYLATAGYQLTAVGYQDTPQAVRTPGQSRGYGEPTFAAFYPNCQTVFGFHDAFPLVTSKGANNEAKKLKGIQYDVLGWYSHSDQDCTQVLRTLMADRTKANMESLEFTAAFKELYQWDVANGAPGTPLPERTVCYARLTLDTDTYPTCVRPDKPVAIAVGNTSTQALSAYLAQTLATERNVEPSRFEAVSSRLEEQLEALPAAARLGDRSLDIGRKFKDARHERGFLAVPAGTSWVIHQTNTSSEYDLQLVFGWGDAAGVPSQDKKNLVVVGIDITGLHIRIFDAGPGPVVDINPIPDEKNRPAQALAIDDLRKRMPDLLRNDALQKLTTDDKARVINEAISIAGHTPPDETLPESLARVLNELNLLQAEYDRAGHELESMQQRLFADWYKYMLCSYPPPDDTGNDYPDIDEVRYFIKKNDLLPITRQQGQRSRLKSRCMRLHAQVAAQVQEYQQRTRNTYELQPRSAPRYWQPREPVLLMVDQDTTPTIRHGQDGRLHEEGLLACRVLSVQDGDFNAMLRNLRTLIRDETKLSTICKINWTEQPWHPFILEWQVELSPLGEGNNLGKNSRDYHPDFITDNYQLEEDAVDLTLRPGKVAVEKAASVFTGSSLLTPHAKIQLQKQIAAFLERTKLPENDEFRTTIAAVTGKLNGPTFHALAQSLSGFNEALLMFKQTLQLPIADPLGFPDAQQFSRAVQSAVGQTRLNAPQPDNDFHPIRTGVFRIHALRLVDTFGRSQNLKLEGGRVRATEIMSTPSNPHLVFLPPRLVQPARLNFRWLAADRGNHWGDDEPEMNDHPATTPICGWLLPNHLDNSLMVYDADGQALGSICQRDPKWLPAPGTSNLPDSRWNVHLRTLVNQLLHLQDAPGQAPTFFESFLDGIEIALERIDPENFAHHTALALLMGRPIAVVRAVVDLQLRGQPAVIQDWNVFRRDITRDLDAELTQPARAASQPAERDTDAVGKVRFPIRLGDDRLFNDGLIGYWKEKWSADGETYTYDKDTFYVHACDQATVMKTDPGNLGKFEAQRTQITRKLETGGKIVVGEVVTEHDFLKLPDGEAIWTFLCDTGVLEELKRNPNIRYAADTPDLAQAIDDAPQKLTMLVDPRGVVHAACGILPTKAIGIPPDQYAKAMQTLAITFLSAPILTGAAGKVCLPTPHEPGYAWSWIEKQNGTWSETAPVRPASLEATFAEAQTIREGWLKLTPHEDIL